MCSGAILLYRIRRVVVGESMTFTGAEEWLAAQGVELVQMDAPACKDLMRQFIAGTLISGTRISVRNSGRRL
jgi:cytosine deaminase